MQLNEYLQKLMDEKGVKQADVMRATGIPRTRLSMIMTGETKNPKLSTIGPLCKYFNISIQDIAENVDLSDLK